MLQISSFDLSICLHSNKENCSLYSHCPQAGSGQDYHLHYSEDTCMWSLMFSASSFRAHSTFHCWGDAIGDKSTPACCTDLKEIFIHLIIVLLSGAQPAASEFRLSIFI